MLLPVGNGYLCRSLVSTIDTNLANIKNWAILDSGASSHFLQVDAPILAIKETANPIQVTVANGEKVSSTHEGLIDVPDLPARARNAHVLPGIKHSLLSVVRLCNAGCEVIFGKYGISVEVRYNGRVIMKGSKSTINGLWYVPITTSEETNPKKSVKFHRERSNVEKEDANSATQVDLGFQSATTAECGIAKS